MKSPMLTRESSAANDSAVARISELAQEVDRFLPNIFLLIALPMVMFFALLDPPFKAPDEFAHFFRSEQISYGDILGTKIDEQNSGGYVDLSYRRFSELFLATNSFCVVLHPERIAPASRETRSEASGLNWTGQREFINCPNTVAYGPITYIPQAAALSISRLVGLSIWNSFYLARSLNGLTAVAIGYLALRLAGRGRFVIFCLMTMPISLFLMGSLSQDALLISGAALVVAIASHALSTGLAPTAATYLALTGLLAALACGRPPYIALSFVFLLKPFGEMRWRGTIFRTWPRLAAILSVVVLTGLWSWLSRDLRIDMRPGASAHGQLQFLLGHIGLLPEIALNTLRRWETRSLLLQLVGVLGWLDLKFPKTFYAIGLLGLFCAFVLETTQSCSLTSLERFIAALAVISGIGATYLAIYLTWEPVGQLFVNSVYGRYVVPLLFGAVFALPTVNDRFKRRWAPGVLILPLVAILGAVVSIATIFENYYGNT